MDFASTLWQGLLANLAAVALLTMLWTQVMPRVDRWKPLRQKLALGSVMGAGALIVMQMPFETAGGFRLDHRFTLIATSAFFGGPVAVAVTAGVASAYRLYIGGIGAWPGLIGIGVSTVIGLAGYYLSTRRKVQKLRHILLFAAVVPAGVIAGLFILPRELWPTTRPDLSLPLALTIFLATLVCALTIHQERRRLSATRSKDIYEAIINALPDCLNVKDLDGRFIAANPATAALMRADEVGALIGRSDFDYYNEPTARRFREDESNVVTQGEPITVEQCIERNDGTLAYLSTLKAPLRDQEGTIIGLITHNRDVTEKRALEADLRQARQTLDDAITNMNDGLVIYDHNGRLTFCNDQYRQLFPATADLRIPGAMLADIARESLDRGERVGNQKTGEEWLRELREKQISRGEHIIQMTDGRWLQVKSVAVESGALFLISDVSLVKEAEAELEASAREYKALFENSVAGIFRSTRDGRMVRANPALARLNGFTTEQELIAAVNNIGQEWYVDPRRREEFVRLIETHGRVTDFVSEVYRFKTREKIWISETAWNIKDADGKLVCYEGTITEATGRKLAEEELQQTNSKLYSLSRTDGLTGLANRRAFDECISAEFERVRTSATPLSLLLIDVDHFKRFNDTYGHIRGDECLRFIAKAVATIPRGYGDKACRYGGEEMGVVLPDTDDVTAQMLAERLRHAVNGLRISHSGSDAGVVTVSIGVATTSAANNFKSVEEFIETADKALYSAKEAGRNKVILAQVA